MKPRSQISFILLCLSLLIGLPLAGVVFAGKPFREYLEFPPLTRYVEHAAFTWWVFIPLALAILGTMVPFILRCLRAQKTITLPPIRKHPFPWWGWLALVITGINWFIAWTRLPIFAGYQEYTFSPLWFGYIVVVNALIYRRTGRCTMLNRPGYFAALFLISALFWWYFEFLNRFVQNWYYEGVVGLNPLTYVIFASLPFATVLPAVLGTYEYLGTFPRLGAGLDNFTTIRIKRSRRVAGITFVVFCFGLTGIGIWPDYLYPLLWVSPLFIITSLKALRGEPTIFTSIETGAWKRIVHLALAALICGFFWEMWNIHSLAKWIYEVPLVGRFKIFEMPVLGYAGYLPFGLECYVIAKLFTKRGHDDDNKT